MAASNFRAAVTRVAALIVVLLLTTAAAHPAASWRGMPLTEALERLQNDGLAILYSERVVTNEMRVTVEPDRDDPRSILEAILAPHQLVAVEQGSLLVIQPAARTGGTLTGRIRVIVAQSGAPRPVVLTLEPDSLRFEFDGPVLESPIPPGSYSLRIDSPGSVPFHVSPVVISAGSTTRIDVDLEPLLYLNEITVTPAQVTLRRSNPERRRLLTSEEIESLPHPGGDLMRAVKQAAGAGSSDLSARFNPRGGGDNEALILFDGAELFEPFHLKDFMSVFSIVDSEAVGSVDLMSGGFPVEYGDRMSAVVDIRGLDPKTTRSEITVGTMHSRLFGAGPLSAGDGDWMTTVRGWYPDAIPDAAGLASGTIRTDFYDALVRIRHRVGARTTISAGLLAARDDLFLDLGDADDAENVAAIYSSEQGWISAGAEISKKLAMRTVVSAASVDRRRHGEEIDAEDGALSVVDEREFEFVSVRSDWDFEIGDRHLLKWGGEAKRERAHYRYQRTLDDHPEPYRLARFIAPEGSSWGLYLSDRVRASDRLVIEGGLRWDVQEWTDGSQLSPRVNVLWRSGSATAVRVGWGRFFQSQRLNELQIEDGVDTFADAELSEHRLFSIERLLPRGAVLRVSAYDKRFQRLRPRFENLFTPMELFPESRDDRIAVRATSAEAHGLEVALRSGWSEEGTWWIGYDWARAEESIDDRNQPRPWDQRHTVNGGISVRLFSGLEMSITATWHSGRPITPLLVVQGQDGDLEIGRGPRNAGRLDPYLRFDLRAEKRFDLSRGDLAIILDVLNLANTRNVCCIEDVSIERASDGSPVIVRETQTWSPIAPSLAARWSF